MTLVVCLDDHMAMMFMRRRQSQDVLQREHLLKVVGDNTLWVSEYTGKLFEEGQVKIDNDFIKKAKKDDYCFVEAAISEEDTLKYDNLLIYKWNRTYPFDVSFPMSKKWVLEKSEDFAGNSHGVITAEFYKKG